MGGGYLQKDSSAPRLQPLLDGFARESGLLGQQATLNTKIEAPTTRARPATNVVSSLGQQRQKGAEKWRREVRNTKNGKRSRWCSCQTKRMPRLLCRQVI